MTKEERIKNPERYRAFLRYNARRRRELYACNPSYREAVKAGSKRRSKKDRAAKRDYLRRVKATTPCADCKHIFPPECMDFDHLPGREKSFGVGESTGRWVTLLRFKQEIAKCEVVCACCHRTRTHKRKNRHE